MSAHQQAASARPSRRRHHAAGASSTTTNTHRDSTLLPPDPFAPSAAITQRSHLLHRPISATSTSTASTLAHDARSNLAPTMNSHHFDSSPLASPHPSTTLDPFHPSTRPQAPPQPIFAPTHARQPPLFQAGDNNPFTTPSQASTPLFPALHAHLADDLHTRGQDLPSSPHAHLTHARDPIASRVSHTPDQHTHLSTPQAQHDVAGLDGHGPDIETDVDPDADADDADARIHAARATDARLLSIARSFFASHGDAPLPPLPSESVSATQPSEVAATPTLPGQRRGRAAAQRQRQGQQQGPREARLAAQGKGAVMSSDDGGRNADDIEDGRCEEIRLEIMARLRECVGEKLEGERWRFEGEARVLGY